MQYLKTSVHNKETLSSDNFLVRFSSKNALSSLKVFFLFLDLLTFFNTRNFLLDKCTDNLMVGEETITVENSNNFQTASAALMHLSSTHCLISFLELLRESFKVAMFNSFITYLKTHLTDAIFLKHVVTCKWHLYLDKRYESCVVTFRLMCVVFFLITLSGDYDNKLSLDIPSICFGTGLMVQWHWKAGIISQLTVDIVTYPFHDFEGVLA